MPTVERSIEKALFARVATIILDPVLPIAWPDLDFTPPLSGYIRVTQIPNRNERMFFGSNAPQRRQGLLQLSVFSQKGLGSPAATEKAGLVAAHFPTDLEMTADGRVVRVTKAPDIATAIADDPHWHVPVTVWYECFA